MICKIVGPFIKGFNAGHKYSLFKNLKKPIQTQLSQKPKLFYEFDSTFLKSRLNFKHFQQKDAPHSSCMSEITESKNVVE